jgi:hypothetical protein
MDSNSSGASRRSRAHRHCLQEDGKVRRSGPTMRIATNLSELGSLGTYRLHPDNDDARFLQQAIQRLLPDAEFAGYVNELADDADTVITVGSRSRDALAGGAMPKDLVVWMAFTSRACTPPPSNHRSL